ncbi:MAG: DNA double-strand break repair nuclease NurA [Bacteroidota bacterium]
MLNFDALHKQFSGFGQYQSQERKRKAILLERALEVFTTYDSSGFEVVEEEIGRPEKLVAVPLEVPVLQQAAGKRPTPMTVVASDGSQIYPDRNVEPLCYLLNLSRIAFQYGTTEQPVMDAVPYLYFKGQDLNAVDGPDIDVAGPEVVSALRDELELQTLLDTAHEMRQVDRPVLAVADGTLIRWMIKRLRRPQLEAQLLQRYFNALDQFQKQQIPLCSYISMPRGTEFINYLALHMSDPASGLVADDFAGITDRMLFQHVLAPGERTAIFRSQSVVLQEYPPTQVICYFYVHVQGAQGASEIARVEFPRWMITDPAMIELVHATVLSECEKGNGYPMILSEAHEHAIVRGQERMVFYEMIEREMLQQGQVLEVSSKKRSKDLPQL